MATELYRDYRVLWLQPINDGRFVGSGQLHCCDDLRRAVAYACAEHPDPFECGDYLIAYNEITDEYGLPIKDGGGSVLLIKHCPFCGTALPDSKADRWFDAVEALGLAHPLDDQIPPAYKTDAWWRTQDKRDT